MSSELDSKKTDNLPRPIDTEPGEHIPTEDEIKAAIEKATHQTLTKIRELSDDQGIYLLEYETPEDEKGWKTLYSYSRQGNFPNNVVSMSTVIYAMPTKDEDFETGFTVADFINAQWHYVVPVVK